VGTVYRNLTALAAAGVIQRLDSASPKARFDGNPKPHCHVRCTRCDRIDDLHVSPSELFETSFDTLNGYKVLGFRLEFSGLCSACKTGDRGADVLSADL
jgi:Fe2+ or Zn2+ uptake regulation protein